MPAAAATQGTLGSRDWPRQRWREKAAPQSKVRGRISASFRTRRGRLNGEKFAELKEAERGRSSTSQPFNQIGDVTGRQDCLECCYLLPRKSEEENHCSTTDSSHYLEDYFPELTSLSEITLEKRLLEYTVPTTNIGSVKLPSFHNSIDLAQAISHDVSLHEAIMMDSEQTSVTNAEKRNLDKLDMWSDSNTSSTKGINMFAYDNHYLAYQDFFLRLDTDRFNETNFTSLAAEENYDRAQTYSFEEQASDSRLLDLNYSNSSIVFTYDKYVKSGFSNDLCDVWGSCLEQSKYCFTDYQSNSEDSMESLVHVFHDHTYNQNTHQLTQSMPEHFLRWSGESNKIIDKTEDDKGKNQNHDEYQAKTLGIPFSVNDIVTLPVDAFHNILSKYNLTDNQLTLIRDIRRRGKNKAAAQTCRKRKLEAIMNLKDEVCHLQTQKERLKKEKAQYNRTINNMKQKLNKLYWNIFRKRRDDQGIVNPSQHTLYSYGSNIILISPGKLPLDPKQ